MAKTVKDQKDIAKTAKKAGKKSGKVHLVVLIDESGSMQGKEEAVTVGCNEFLESFSGNKQARAWIGFFDHMPGEDKLRLKIKGKKIANVDKLVAGDYRPRGGTPLNDAILETLSALDAEVADDETVFMAIITDGMENMSEVKDPKVVADAIAKFEKRGWAFVYLGANQHAETSAAAIGLARTGQAFNFAATRGGVRATTRSLADMGHAHSHAYEEHGAGAMALAASEATRSAAYVQTGGKIEEIDDDE